jgi:hypothetical protein
MLQRKCGCGGTCGSCSNESQLTRSAIVTKSGAANIPGGTEDPIHQPMIDEMRERGFDPQGFPDAYLKYSCPPGRSTPRSTVTVQPVRIARDDGSQPTNALSFDVARTLWNQCCITLNVRPTTTLNNTSYQAVDDLGNNTFATQEELDVAAAVGGTNQINVISIRAFTVNGTESTDTWGGGVTFGTGAANPFIFLIQSAVPEVVAHEIGHGLGFPNDHADSAGTIMEPTGSPTVANPSVVNNSICRRSRNAPLHRMAAASRCCKRFD